MENCECQQWARIDPPGHPATNHHPNCPKVGIELWLLRCAARFQSVAGIGEPEAMDAAEQCLEYIDNDIRENPEEAADEEMANWID